MITQVTYERVFNLGSYESERISATATVDNGDLDAAFYEVRMAVEYEHTRTVSDRKVATQAAEYVTPPASDKQRNYITTLQDKLGWQSEQMAAYAQEQGYDLADLNRSEASGLIDGLVQLTKQENIIKWADRVVPRKQAEETEDIPF